MEEYEINEYTNAIIAQADKKTKVVEDEREFIVEKKAFKIMDDSCKYFGSSYQGRFEGSKKILGSKIYKAPIIVEETRGMIYFPTTSARLDDCSWFSLQKIKRVEKKEYKTEIYFQNNKNIVLDISYESFQNQLLRASRLDSILRQRKKEI